MGVAGDRIKQCRLACHLTQDEVAQKLGIAKQTIFKYETGLITNIPLENLEHLSRLFHVPPEYLAGWKDSIPVLSLPRKDETQLLSLYRELPDDGKALLLRQAIAAKIMYETEDETALKLAESDSSDFER